MPEFINAADIPVVIPAGGQGMRLREETDRVPKPMVEIGGLPIMWHIMKVFATHGHRKFIVLLGYKGWVIKDWFLTYDLRLADICVDLGSNDPPQILRAYDPEDWSVTCAETGLHTGTVGRLQMITDYIDAPYFMYAYGDSIGDVDVTKVRERHETNDNLVTVTGVRPRNRFGILTADENQQVTAFTEKPMITSGHANGGFAALDRSVLERLKSRSPAEFIEDVLPELTTDGGVGLHEHSGFWLGMDTMRDVVALQEMWDGGNAPWKVWED